MNLKEKVVLLMDKQSQTVKKNKVFQVESENALDELGIPRNSEFYYFYSHYFAQITFAERETAPEMADCICPDKALKVFSTFAHESWQIPKNYIFFTSWSSESGYLYNILDNTVWDFDLGKRELLGTDKMHHWNSFYEFLVWYLTTE